MSAAQSVAARRRAPAMARGSKSDRAPAKSNEEAEETPSPAPQAADPPQEQPEAAPVRAEPSRAELS